MLGGLSRLALEIAQSQRPPPLHLKHKKAQKNEADENRADEIRPEDFFIAMHPAVKSVARPGPKRNQNHYYRKSGRALVL